MIEELQAAWDRPGEVSFKPQSEDLRELQFSDGVSWHAGSGWALGWKITRPVKMWFGKLQTHSYGAYVYGHDELTREDILDTLHLVREQFDMTMKEVDRPAWQRFIHKRLPRLSSHLRGYAEHRRACRRYAISLSLCDELRAVACGGLLLEP